MKLTHRSEGRTDIVSLEGRFDAYEVPILNQWFDDHPQSKQVILNLEGVGFVDSSGLASLIRGMKRCRSNAGDMYLSNMQQAVRIIFELARLDSAFRIFADDTAALQAFPA